MAEITKELGRVPICRGEFNLATTYYKDNIVQYKRGSYQVVSESPIVNVPPINDNGDLNPEWILFAGTLHETDYAYKWKAEEPTRDGQTEGELKDLYEYSRDLGLFVQSSSYLRVYTDANDRLLFAIKSNGDILFGYGIPSQIKAKLAQLQDKEETDFQSLFESFETKVLNITDEATIKSLIAETVTTESLQLGTTKEQTVASRKFIETLIDSNYRLIRGITKDGINILPKLNTEYQKAKKLLLDNIAQIQNGRSSNFIEIVTDSNGIILRGITKEGHNYLPYIDSEEFNLKGCRSFYQSNRFVRAMIDANGKILYAVDKKGKTYVSSLQLPKKEEKNVNTRIITIANTSKIGVFSTSFTNGYCMKNHHLLDNLSMFSDYVFYNYGKSASTPPETLTRINANETWLGDMPVQNWGIDYGIIIFQENDALIHSVSPDAYLKIYEKLANTVKAMGGTPIFVTEHDYHNGSDDCAYYIQQTLQNKYGYTFINTLRLSSALMGGFDNNGIFEPFWHSRHPATRTHWLWTNALLPYIESLPRPVQGLKIFRVRDFIDTSNKLNLIYNNILERAKRFVEISCGASVLTKDTEKYFDRLNSNLMQYEDVKDEYQKLQAQTSSLSFNKYALIEGILPYIDNNVKVIKLNLTGNNIQKVYIKKNVACSNFLRYSRNLGFGVESGIEHLTIGQKFTITGGTFDTKLQREYTITGFVNGKYVTTTQPYGNEQTSGTDVITTNISGVTFKGSYRMPNKEFFDMVGKSWGDWIEIPVKNDTYEVPTELLNKCIDFDKVAFLVESTDSFTISDIRINVEGSGEKVNYTQKPILTSKEGESVITDSLFDDGTTWNELSEIAKYIPVQDPITSKKEALPLGITTVRELTEGQSLSQTINTSKLSTNSYTKVRLQIKIIARYFPLYVDNDTKWVNSEVTEDSFDCAELAIKINGYPCSILTVGAYWNQYITEIEYIWGNTLTIECTNKKVQIAKVELIKC